MSGAYSTSLLAVVMCTSNECTRKGDKKPMKASWARLKRQVRYMGRTPPARVVIMKPGADYDSHVACLRVWSESDSARNVKDGKK